MKTKTVTFTIKKSSATLIRGLKDLVNLSKVGSEWEEPKCTVGAGCALVYFVYGRRMEGKKAGLGAGGLVDLNIFR